jgi:hypothetical protein
MKPDMVEGYESSGEGKQLFGSDTLISDGWEHDTLE